MTRKFITLLVMSTAILLPLAPAQAVPPLGTATLNSPGTTKTLVLPPAADSSPVISLGTAVDPGSGKPVEGLAIIHRKYSQAKSAPAKPRGTTCYGYLARGAKWKTLEPWLVNPANITSLDTTAVFELLTGGISKWEANAGADVLGFGAATVDILNADMVSPDNQNEVYFADIADPDSIAVTIVWGIFGGPVSGRQLVEWDQVYDDVTFDWSAESAGVAGRMDFDNIATHELGHSVGMADLYNSCVDETMYGYSVNAETKKRDLNTGDITGVTALY